VKAGVLINPSSGRNRGKGLALAHALENNKSIEHHVLSQFTDLRPALASMAGAGVDLLYVSSGDGTVQAIQTLLAEDSPFPTPPRICLLPHGTTNMNAADVGLKLRHVAAQAAFIRAGLVRHTVQRATLRVDNPADGKPRHGMFLGTGALAQAVRMTQTGLNDRGVKGDLAGAVMLVSSLLKYLTRVPDPTDLNRIDRPHDMAVSVDQKTACTGPQLLLLVTVLDRLMMGTHPFWGSGDGALRMTVIGYPPPSPLRWTLPLLYGAPEGRKPTGAISCRASALSISGPVDYVIDGEFFRAPADGRLSISTGPLLTYVTG
jgi:hypothetical protein